MTDRARTGNVLLDAWLDALAPFRPAAASVTSDAQDGTPTTNPTPPIRERNIFGDALFESARAFSGGANATSSFATLWSDIAQRSLGVAAALGSTSNAGDPLGEALEKSFGVTGDLGATAAAGASLLAEAAKASSVLLVARETYRALMLATWQRAFEEIAREAVRRASEGKPVVTPAHWLTLSNLVADRVFVEAFNSQPYIDAQSRLSSALADQRRSEVQLVELFAQFGHFPTRRALDEVNAEVSELRRRVRRLERASRGAQQRRQKSETSDVR